MSSVPVAMVVNGTRHEGTVEPRQLLSDFLRDELELKGVKISCDIGICGACTIIMGGLTVRACLTFAIQADGQELMTVEGLAKKGTLHPIQEAFWDSHALQCGYCTPGILLTAYQLLQRNDDPTEQEIRETLNGNLCRCTGYVHIVQAIRLAAARMRAKAQDKQVVEISTA
jgi:aerobic-type carbon monoxide dehydrogenase small subunit (CoxS/CutS family)